MVIVKVELWPHGYEKNSRPLGGMIITNDGTGTIEYGNYECKLLHSGKYFGKPGVYKSGKVIGFNRKQSPYHLILKALKAALEDEK